MTKPSPTIPIATPTINIPSVSLVKPTIAKSPFSGMDGKNSYDIDLNLDM